MNKITTLPFRQKILLGLTISVGLLILISYKLGLIEPDQLLSFILGYSFGVTLWLLAFQTLVDLNDSRIFYIWLAIGLTQFCIYLLTKNNVYFEIIRSPDIKKESFLNKYVSNSATSPLKTLLYFLIAYKVFNTIMKKLTGNCLLNTYRQMSWNHDKLKRKISGLDVLFNFLLLAVIIISALIR